VKEARGGAEDLADGRGDGFAERDREGDGDGAGDEGTAEAGTRTGDGSTVWAGTMSRGASGLCRLEIAAKMPATAMPSRTTSTAAG
jgi:hypothetical protein